tara:strand:+ start:70 stop:507 length:438 start_codon:yes stop_codon:yes gene_type:complete
MDEEGFWESIWKRLNEVYGPGGELGGDSPVQIGEGSYFGTPNYGGEWSGEPPKPFYPNQIGIPPSGPTVAVENYEAQNPPKVEEEKTPEEKEEDWMNQLLMAALMAGGKRGGRSAPTAYGVGAQVPFGEPWRMRRDWERDYRYIK